MEALKGFIAWRWTPFFALLTVALVVSLVTILAVPSTPLTLFKAETVKAAAVTADRSAPGTLARTGVGAVAGRTATLSGKTGGLSTGVSGGVSTPARRGGLQKMIDANQANARDNASPPERAARRFARSAPELAAPPLPPARHEVPAPEEEVEEEVEEEAEEEAEPAEGAGGAEGDAEGEGESEDDAPAGDVGIDRPQVLSPGTLRAIPRLQAPGR